MNRLDLVKHIMNLDDSTVVTQDDEHGYTLQSKIGINIYPITWNPREDMKKRLVLIERTAEILDDTESPDWKAFGLAIAEQDTDYMESVAMNGLPSHLKAVAHKQAQANDGAII